jgi:uncharacterized protein (DUF433 family)
MCAGVVITRWGKEIYPGDISRRRVMRQISGRKWHYTKTSHSLTRRTTKYVLEFEKRRTQTMPIVKEGGVIGDMPHIQGHRIAVHHIVNLVVFGSHSVKEVATELYPELTEDEVQEAIEFAYEDTERWTHLMEEHEREKQSIEQQAISPDDVING